MLRGEAGAVCYVGKQERSAVGIRERPCPILIAQEETPHSDFIVSRWSEVYV